MNIFHLKHIYKLRELATHSTTVHTVTYTVRGYMLGLCMYIHAIPKMQYNRSSLLTQSGQHRSHAGLRKKQRYQNTFYKLRELHILSGVHEDALLILHTVTIIYVAILCILT